MEYCSVLLGPVLGLCAPLYPWQLAIFTWLKYGLSSIAINSIRRGFSNIIVSFSLFGSMYLRNVTNLSCHCSPQKRSRDSWGLGLCLGGGNNRRTFLSTIIFCEVRNSSIICPSSLYHAKGYFVCYRYVFSGLLSYWKVVVIHHRFLLSSLPVLYVFPFENKTIIPCEKSLLLVLWPLVIMPSGHIPVF
jgi:hypothetical protein